MASNGCPSSRRLSAAVESTEETGFPSKAVFCWFCFKRIDKPFITCSSCRKRFDYICVQNKDPSEMAKISGNSSSHLIWICFECRPNEAHEEDPLSGLLTEDELSRFLSSFIKTIKERTEEEGLLETDHYNNPEVDNPIDFKEMEERVNKRIYASWKPFADDLKWMYQNAAQLNLHKLMKQTKDNYDVFVTEVEEMSNGCVDCILNYYYNYPESGFTALCRRPHGVVWARVKGWPFWPAKTLAINESRTRVEVRFFESKHSRAWIRVNECYFFSYQMVDDEKDQKLREGKKFGASFAKALEEVDQYLKQFEATFGAKPRVAPPKISFNPDKLYLRQISPE